MRIESGHTGLIPGRKQFKLLTLTFDQWRRKMKQSFRLLPKLIMAVGLFANACMLNADDTGIDKARLIEQSLGQYVIEIDTKPRLAGAYRQPVFPRRFEMMGAVERDRKDGYLAIRYRFKTVGEPLGDGDTLVLPWNRSGVALTVQWADGQMQQGLFLRDVAGIEIDVGTFRSKTQSKGSVASMQSAVGLKHGLFGWCHIFLVLSASLLCKKLQIYKLLIMFAVGGAVSLILVDVGLPPLPATIVEVCILLTSLLFVRSAAIGQEAIARFLPLMILTGVLDGLGHYEVLTLTGTDKENLLPALFGLVLGTNVAQLVLALVFTSAIALIAKMNRKSATLKTICLLVGGGVTTAIAVILTHMAAPYQTTRVLADKNPELNFAGLGQAVTNRPSTRQLRSQQASSPLTGYLSIEPFEVRLELLLHLRSVTEMVDFELLDQVPVDRQSDVASKVQTYFLENVAVSINGQSVSPDFQQSNFVQVTAGGILIRQQPIPELVESAVLGLVFSFETDELAENIELQWKLFPADSPSVTFSISDPFSALQQSLSRQSPVLFWENKLVGFQPPRAKPVPVSKISLPVYSAIVAGLSGLLWILRRNRPVNHSVNVIVLLGFTVAAGIYPFVRWPVDIQAVNVWLINKNEASSILDALLTNAYRAVEIRSEDKSYDRLAQSVVGDQLREFYLQCRKSVELKERDGVRARIDQVVIEEIKSVNATKAGEIEIDARWTASGSVNHYGHTHYRNNLYEAIVQIVPVEGIWKIKKMQIIDEFSLP